MKENKILQTTNYINKNALNQQLILNTVGINDTNIFQSMTEANNTQKENKFKRKSDQMFKNSNQN